MITTKTPAFLLMVLVLTTGLITCKKEQEPVITSATAQRYVDEVLGLMQAHSINRKAIDWTAVDCYSDMFVPHPKHGTKGVRVTVK